MSTLSSETSPAHCSAVSKYPFALKSDPGKEGRKKNKQNQTEETGSSFPLFHSSAVREPT